MPKEGLRHQAALDGVRGVAILAVLLYHGGMSWAGGGFLGVEIFFVLSGFLITSLLLGEWRSTGTVRLRAFWARRARRLLPALLCMIAVVGVYYAFAGPSKLVPGLLGDGASTLLYYANWHQIATGTSYFAVTGPTSPFQHTWSLAIEEQFYIVWPLAMLAVGIFAKRRPGWISSRHRWPGFVVLGLAVASGLEMAIIYGGGSPAAETRVYFGTDTRAQGLLVGAALAWLVSRVDPELAGRGEARRHRLLSVGALVGAAGLVGIAAIAGGQSSWLYRGGFLAVDAFAAAVIAACFLVPRSIVGRVLATRPLVALGTVSYGLYLWHFPLFLWLTEQSVGISGVGLLALRLGASLAAAIASFYLVEQPVRRRRLPRWMIAGLAPVGAATALASLLVATTVPVPAAVASTHRGDEISARLVGSASCDVSLSDRRGYGLAPIAAKDVNLDEYASLLNEQVVWRGGTRLRFHTCPPRRVLLVGDSIAYTLGVGLLDGEQRYGVELADAPLLGCSFGLRGKLQVDGEWVSPPTACGSELPTWRADERDVHPQAVVVELGYRDSFDWTWGGRVVHLGDARYDAYVEARIVAFARVLGQDRIPVLFVDVPLVDPSPGASGAPLPQASRTRHSEIDLLLSRAARANPQLIHVFDLDPYVAPGGRYMASIGGHACRMVDGIHFTPWCGSYVAPFLFREVRRLTG